MASVVIAAHNEAAVIGRCLDALMPYVAEVIVVANGCTDDTAAIARRQGATVIERPEASKAGALNAGDRAASTFPRLFIDADVVLKPGAVAALTRALEHSGALAAVPLRRLDLAGRPWLVRGYHAIHSRLPASRNGLYGRGVIALSAAGRARFGEFPAMVADDLFLDSLYRAQERIIVEDAAVTVAAPTRTGDLLRRLTRVRAGNAQMRQSSSQVRRSRRLSWLTDVVVPAPWLAPAAACYVAITAIAAVQARRRPTDPWGRDDSTRA